MFCISTVLPVRGGAAISARTAPRGIAGACLANPGRLAHLRKPASSNAIADLSVSFSNLNPLMAK